MRACFNGDVRFKFNLTKMYGHVNRQKRDRPRVTVKKAS